MQFLRSFILVATQLWLGMRVLRWRGGCTRRGFCAAAGDARQGAGCQHESCEPASNALMMIALVFHRLNTLLGSLALRKKVVLEEQHLLSQQRFPSPSVDCAEWDLCSCLAAQRWNACSLSTCWFLVEDNHVQWSSGVPYPQERRTGMFIWVSGGRENNVMSQMLFSCCSNQKKIYAIAVNFCL